MRRALRTCWARCALHGGMPRRGCGRSRRDVPRWAWGVAMNMMYSDYYGVAVDFGVNRPEFYAALAEAFLMDKDGPGPEAKLCAYYRGIVERGR